MAQPDLPNKLFFKIGEVAKIVGVRPHVLRYWESEFAALKPMKTRGSHRVYKRRDVELAVLVKQLLQDEGYTIAGARKRLKELGRDRVTSDPDPDAARAVAVRADLLVIRKELTDALKQLDALRNRADDGGGDRKAVVTGASPSSSAAVAVAAAREKKLRS